MKKEGDCKMKREVVKIRVLCGVNGVPDYGYIRYEDEVPDETHVWKATRRHNDESVVEIGEIWTNLPIVSDDGAPCWNAYAILDASASREEKEAKARELFEVVKKAVAEDAKALVEKAENAEFDSERFEKLRSSYDGESKNA